MRLLINGFWVEGTATDFREILGTTSESVLKDRKIDLYTPKITDCSILDNTSEVSGSKK